MALVYGARHQHVSRKIWTIPFTVGLTFSIHLFSVCFSNEMFETANFRISPLYNDAKSMQIISSSFAYNRRDCARMCLTEVGSTCAFLNFNSMDKTCSVYNLSLFPLSFSSTEGARNYEVVPLLSQFDCYDVMMNGHKIDGIYTITTRDNSTPIKVFCEITDGYGWMVIQRRIDGSEDFYRNWTEYRDGFGDLENEFWLGNAIIHTLTSQDALYRLRVDLEDFDGQRVFALYDGFLLDTEGNYFQLTLGPYSGDSGDSLSYHSGKNFSTYDVDLDLSTSSCSTSYKGGWWYGACHSSNLNGLYLAGNHTSYADGVDWSSWLGYHYSLKTSVMKIGRRVKFCP